MGDINYIQRKFDAVIYNLWGMKETNYVMKIMDTSGRLLADNT